MRHCPNTYGLNSMFKLPPSEKPSWAEFRSGANGWSPSLTRRREGNARNSFAARVHTTAAVGFGLRLRDVPKRSTWAGHQKWQIGT